MADEEKTDETTEEIPVQEPVAEAETPSPPRLLLQSLAEEPVETPRSPRLLPSLRPKSLRRRSLHG